MFETKVKKGKRSFTIQGTSVGQVRRILTQMGFDFNEHEIKEIKK